MVRRHHRLILILLLVALGAGAAVIIGGLYNGITVGQMVESFESWCFDETRKEGDVGVVHTDYGCHLIYFVGVRDITYREYMITTDMRAEDSEAWFTGLRDALKANAKVGSTSGLNTGIILSQ